MTGARAVPAWTAWRALVRMFTSAVRSRSASVTAIGMSGSRSSWTSLAVVPAHAAAADARQMSLRFAGASSKRIGLAKSSTSVTR